MKQYKWNIFFVFDNNIINFIFKNVNIFLVKFFNYPIYKNKSSHAAKMYLHPIPIFDCLPGSSSRSIFVVCETKDDLRKMEKGICEL